MQASGTRQLGLDWLRIGAFAILILYHIGMFFGPWSWHINAVAPVDWLQWPMMAVNPWRLALLFVISGIVSRSLLAKVQSPGSFARSRSHRLLLPLLFGMVLLVAPQPWLQLRDGSGYDASFLHFWLNDYFEFGSSRGTPLPTWNHLWFVVYLWLYTSLLALVAMLPAPVLGRIKAGVDRYLSGWSLLVLPLLWISSIRLFLFPFYGETHALVDDPYAHAFYGFCFFMGVALGKPGPMWGLIDRHWRAFLAAALLAALLRVGLNAGGQAASLSVLKAIAFALTCWSAVLGLLGMARAKLNVDRPARRYLNEAVFPFYLVHQTLIIVAGYWTKQHGVGGIAAFLLVLAFTMAGCLLTFELARRLAPLRPWLGLGPKVCRQPSSPTPSLLA
jgi:peptidoglycan/LPS O-acetylase OafA/YrhL